MFDDNIGKANEITENANATTDCADCKKLKAENQELETGIAVVSVTMFFVSIIVGLVTWMSATKKYNKGGNA